MYIFAAMLNVRLAIKYLLHRITANNRHGLHSPFVYRLVDEVIYDFCAKNAYHELKKQDAEFRYDRTFTTPSLKVLQLLYRLLARFQPQVVYTVGLHNPVIASVFRLALPGIEIGEINNLKLTGHPALVYVDAGSSSALQLLQQIAPSVQPDDVIIIQNIYRNPQGRSEWQAIKAHPQVMVTIDLFWLQLVFFRAGQRKEHFRVKY